MAWLGAAKSVGIPLMVVCDTVLKKVRAETGWDLLPVLRTGDSSMWGKACDKRQNKGVRYVRWRVQMFHR